MSTIDTIKSYRQPRKIANDQHRSSMIVGMLNWLGSAVASRRSRIDLGELTDDQLRDIGVTKSEARREIARSFWDYEA